MLRVIVAGVRARKARTVLTGLAVMVGVGFLAGTLVYRDTASTAFYEDLAKAGIGVDVAVQRPQTLWSRWLTVDQSTVDKIRAVPGVATVDTRVVTPLPMLDRSGRVLSNGGAPGVAVSLPAQAGSGGTGLIGMFSPTAGRLPVTAGEAALDGPTAEREGLHLNEAVTVLDPAERPHQLIVVGLVDFGPSTFAGFSALVLTADDLRRLTPATGFSQVAVQAAPGTDATTLADRVAAAVGPEYEVLSGPELRDRLARDSAKYADGLLAALEACALVALVVAGLTVHNTFSILMAQRAREFALLRCLGARRRQLLAVASAESFVVGLIASAGGVGLSLVAARAILLARGVVGGAVPGHALVLSRSTVLVTLAVGTIVTVLCGLPAVLGAVRTSPLAAVRQADEAVPPRRGLRRMVAALLALAGAALVAIGTGWGPASAGWGRLGAAWNPTGTGPDPTSVGPDPAGAGSGLTGTGLDGSGLAGSGLAGSGLASAGPGFAGTPAAVAGAMLVFVAVVALLPLVVGRLTGVAGWLPARIFGATGRLAIANARRQPRRSAATVATLMTGVGVMSMFAVVLATAGVQGERELAENFPVDFAVSAVARSADDTALPAGISDRLRGSPQFRDVARTRQAAGLVDGADTVVAAVEAGALGVTIVPEVVAGSLADLAADTVALRASFAGPRHLGVGTTVQMGRWPDRHWPARVVALIDDTPTRGDALVSWPEFSQRYGDGDERVLLRRADGLSAAAARAALDAVLRAYPFVSVESAAERHDALHTELDKRLVEFGGLLGVSALIAIVGIMDMLALAVVERERESALLRALGLSAGQLRRTLVLEAVLTAATGGLVGAALGTGFGWILAAGLIRTYGHGSPVVPVGQLALFVGAAALAGVLGSLLPARRAGRTLPMP